MSAICGLATDRFLDTALAQYERHCAVLERAMEQIGVNSILAQHERQRTAFERVMERMGVDSALAQHERQRVAFERAMEQIGVDSILAQYERQRAEFERVMERVQMNSALTRYERRRESALLKFGLDQSNPVDTDLEISDSAGLELSVSHSQSEEHDLAAEVQDCAIELLMLLNENELPDWTTSKREQLAWNLAHAAQEFILDLLRLMGRIPDFHSRNEPYSDDRFTEFRQRD